MAFVNALRPSWPFMSRGDRGLRAARVLTSTTATAAVGPTRPALTSTAAARALPRTAAGPAPAPEFHIHLGAGAGSAAGLLPVADALSATELATGWGWRRLVVRDEALRHPGLRLLLAHARQRSLRTELRLAGEWPLAPGATDLMLAADEVTVAPLALLPSPQHPTAADAPLFFTLERLARAELPFHVRLPVVRENLDVLDALAARVRAAGAQSLTLVPTPLPRQAGTPLDDAEKALLHVSALLLDARHGARMPVRCELMPLAHVLAQPAVVYAQGGAPASNTTPAQQLGVLALAADGTLLPLAAHFDRRFAVGPVREASRLGSAAAWAAYARRGQAALHELGRGLFADLALDAPVVVDVLDVLVQTAALPNSEIAPRAQGEIAPRAGLSAQALAA